MQWTGRGRSLGSLRVVPSDEHRDGHAYGRHDHGRHAHLSGSDHEPRHESDGPEHLATDDVRAGHLSDHSGGGSSGGP